jgi:hypothetical protein
VLLEAVAFRDGEPFQRITTEQVAFDHAIDPERFRFAPPVGDEVQPPWDQHRVHHVPLAEAQQLAPFTVLVPGRIPADWGASYTFIEPSRRPPSAACVSINFRSGDGHQSVSLSQYAIGDQPDQYNLSSSATTGRRSTATAPTSRSAPAARLRRTSNATRRSCYSPRRPSPRSSWRPSPPASKQPQPRQASDRHGAEPREGPLPPSHWSASLDEAPALLASKPAM